MDGGRCDFDEKTLVRMDARQPFLTQYGSRVTSSSSSDVEPLEVTLAVGHFFAKPVSEQATALQEFMERMNRPAIRAMVA
jgi:hypothetical protein